MPPNDLIPDLRAANNALNVDNCCIGALLAGAFHSLLYVTIRFELERKVSHIDSSRLQVKRLLFLGLKVSVVYAVLYG